MNWLPVARTLSAGIGGLTLVAGFAYSPWWFVVSAVAIALMVWFAFMWAKRPARRDPTPAELIAAMRSKNAATKKRLDFENRKDDA